MADDNDEIDYVITTTQVDPDLLDKLDTKNSSREKDMQTIKMPSHTNVCSIQLWEVYFAVGVILLQPVSPVVIAHVKAILMHNDSRYLCETVLKEHQIGMCTDVTQDISIYSFFEEYMFRKFGIAFSKNALLKYFVDAMDDPLCGKHKIPRVFLLSPFVQAFLLNTGPFEGQYDEMVDSMRMYNLPVFDVLAEPEADVGDIVDINWDIVKMYDDPTLVLKKYGGWATTKGHRMIAPKDQLMVRLTGMSIDQILAAQEVPDSPRQAEQLKELDKRSSTLMTLVQKRGLHKSLVRDADEDSLGSSHPSDYEVDPEHTKIMPLGLSISEAFCLLRGMLVAQEGGWPRCVVSEPMQNVLDGHQLAAAVLIDLYMRDQIDVHHWTLNAGNVAVPYKVMPRAGLAPMDHFLDSYMKYVDMIFRDMRLPGKVGDYPIWRNLEKRGIIDNHRVSSKRAYGCLKQRVEVWDLVRPDLLADLKAGYLLSARVLYDQSFQDGLTSEYASDQLMFFFVLQSIFDLCFECLDAMARVLNMRSPPFEKGELFPPVEMVHAGAVCLGLTDRAFRVATHDDIRLAQEAAEFNEVVMQRFEKRFFQSPKVWEYFDVDGSGELSLEEFVDGMRSIDLYKDFRKERIPEEVLKMIIADLAERLFNEVDVNMDGTLTTEELQNAFQRRRQEALREREQKQWFRASVRRIAENVSGKEKDELIDSRIAAKDALVKARQRAKLMDTRRTREWSADVDKSHFLDEDYDVAAPLAYVRED